MSDSPAVILYDAAGNPVLVKAGDTVVPASQSYVPILGLDGTTARPIAVDSSGRTKMQADALPLPSGAATETTLASRATEATVATLATETKLEAVRALLATIDADTGALAAVDYATQTTLASLLSAFSAEDFASETTLAALKTAFDARDLATQTTLAALLLRSTRKILPARRPLQPQRPSSTPLMLCSTPSRMSMASRRSPTSFQ